jgi:hypothetical protein
MLVKIMIWVIVDIDIKWLNLFRLVECGYL